MNSNTNSFIKRIRQSIFLLLALLVLSSHDLYVKMETYFLQPNQAASLSLYNGTFERSESIITRDRMLDASFVAQGERTLIDPAQWLDPDKTVTELLFSTGEAGTYVVGVSTKARNLELPAQEFNDYLEHNGVSDMLESRTNQDLLDQDAVESYQKHVKAIFQVGDIKTNDWNTVLGYPIEFVPQANPYDKYGGDELSIQLLLDGQPLPNQLVYVDHIHGNHEHSHHDHDHDHSHDDHDHDHAHDEHDHDHDHSHDDHDHAHDSDEAHAHTNGQALRTDDQGMLSVNLPADGIYYLRTIHMLAVADSDELTHQSKWATLTFEVGHKHDDSTHSHDDHDHDHDHEDGIPTWAFILGSLLAIGILFLLFRNKN